MGRLAGARQVAQPLDPLVGQELSTPELVTLPGRIPVGVDKLWEGTIVDATIIAAPSSTKNRAGERDPEMHQREVNRQE